jgi:fibro-slime domain-containing protein
MSTSDPVDDRNAERTSLAVRWSRGAGLLALMLSLSACLLSARGSGTDESDPDERLPAADGGDPGDGGDVVDWTNGSLPPPPEPIDDVPCSDQLRVVVRDFKDTHPDFESSVGADPGIVLRELGNDDKPVYAGNPTTLTTHGREAFDQWYRDVPGVNIALPFAFLLSGAGDGSRGYGNLEFFPIDQLGYGNERRRHNFHFTLELHARFEYEGGEVLTVSGSDIFVFINRKLAADLGGVHTPVSETVDLDARAQELGIAPGKAYSLDLFFAERHTMGSTFGIATTLACIAPAR